MIHRYVVAIGAGCAAALLFAVSAQTSPLAMALAYLAPLPIMIATLGWGLGAGAAAAAISALALTALAEPLSGLLYAASVAAPAWLLAAFAVAPVGPLIGRSPSRSGQASVGAIVALAAAIGMAAATIVLTAVIVVYHGYGEGAKEVAAALAKLASQAMEDGVDEASAREFADALVRVGPAAIAASTFLMLCVNLYAAARSAQLSHRLARPWADLPTSLSLPWPLGLFALVSLAGFFALPVPASQYFSIGAGGLGGAFVLQGLAVAHALSRGLKLRPVMLAALYACCLLRAKYTLPVLAALGLIDAFARLRARPALLPSPHPKTAQK
ncbi:MAG: DUF2232 domain-containing protein [Hyphomicrobiales bacterium]|nr:DUF2232 domain-containing protein [Hyphomicrobiales bacterium]